MIKPLGERVVVKVAEQDMKTASGIVRIRPRKSRRKERL